MLEHADTTTENGAIGIAFAVINRETTYTVHAVHGKAGGGGFDYWLADRSNLQITARLEATGICQGNDSRIKARVKEKSAQIERSDSWGLPGVIVVVEFGTPIVEIHTK